MASSNTKKVTFSNVGGMDDPVEDTTESKWNDFRSEIPSLLRALGRGGGAEEPSAKGGSSSGNATAGTASPPPLDSIAPRCAASDDDSDYHMFKGTFCGSPSNYDVLCGGEDDQEYSNCVGNRRFRIAIEMRKDRYESYFAANFLPGITDGEHRMRQFLDDTLELLSSTDPPCRFLAPLGGVGETAAVEMWGVLRDVRAREKIRETFNECMLEGEAVPV